MDWLKSSISKRKDRDSLSSPTESTLFKESIAEELAQERLTNADFAILVALPPGVDVNEWLASHTVSFFEHISQICGCLSDACRTNCCQNSSITFQWVDDKGKKSKCNAPQFVDIVLSSVQKLVEDESVFPTKYGNKFPPSFEATIRKIHARLQQIINHLYQCHVKDVVDVQLAACLNTTYHHFRQFNDQFQLLDAKDNELLDPFYQRLQILAHQHRQHLQQLKQQQLSQQTTSLSTPPTPMSPFSPSLPPAPPSSSSLTFLPQQQVQQLSYGRQYHPQQQQPTKRKIFLSQSGNRNNDKNNIHNNNNSSSNNNNNKNNNKNNSNNCDSNNPCRTLSVIS